MHKKRNKQNGTILVILVIIFTLGLILGAVSLFYIPKDIVAETRDLFNYKDAMQSTFVHLFKNNFVIEIMWMLAVWLLGSMNFTAPFSATIVSLRGFFIGFSIAFMITGNEDNFSFMLTNILPQCVAALPVMTIFTSFCIRLAIDRKHTENMNFKYFLTGAIFVIGTVAVSFLESTLTWVFINYI